METELLWESLLPLLPHNRTVCRGILGHRVATQGSGPCEEGEFDEFLDACGIGVHVLSNDGTPPAVVIFGREEWQEADVDALWARTEGEGVRVYSQEMVLASMAIGVDLYEISNGEITDLMHNFIIGHAALERFFYVEPDSAVNTVNFPDTVSVAPKSDRKLVVNLDTGHWPSSGVLGALGYRVGRNGLPQSERRTILAEVLTVELVAGSPAANEYIKQWGEPDSVRRLQKMINSIAAFARNARRRTGDFSEAIADWESDLQWLRSSYG
ncbi:hypothetical protein [Mycolicibacterium hippocampi]|uniref:Uncharacterized protein n=1 Tax=Mycolicibacterium hippocampi TaxID=659824 RepID=A0A850PIP1_9MYCO|nr:hypothetical protein [Mycolicibacterium hippocampi]NVN50298.1 hypothetical protein [Mycolicibacterium hippocampi]